MSIDTTLVNLSRLQFAVTAMYHFLFVPLTLGLSVIIGIMESVYVASGLDIWRKMTRFWSKLFAINFAMGIATGVTMEFQFGTNWAYYSHYVGDIFGVPLAIEGMMAFFLESTFVGLMIFGWDKLSKKKHLLVTWLTALGANLSALWILIANGWMQNPVGATFNPETMRMELTSLYEVVFNEVAQSKFVHTVSSGYVVGAIFVLAVSAFYILKNRELEIAYRSIAVACSFGLLSSISLIVLGDESGYVATQGQKMKIAAIEGMWETEDAPASFTLFGIPDQQRETVHYAVKIPYVLGIIATRSLDQKVLGIIDLRNIAEDRIRDGLEVHKTYKEIESSGIEDAGKTARSYIAQNFNNLGHALLLKRYRDDIENASEYEIKQAAMDVVPKVAPLFWSFRLMVAMGFHFILLFAISFYIFVIKKLTYNKQLGMKILLYVQLWSLPLPWIASELGWFVAEYGRQPWVIEGILPTFLGVSSVSTNSVAWSLTGFVVFYTVLFIVDVFLMVKYVKAGPSYLDQEEGIA